MIRRCMVMAMLAALPLTAAAQVALGRLFATPQERAAMDAARLAPAAPPANAMAAAPVAVAPEGPAMAPGAPPQPPGTAAPPPTSTLTMNGILRSSDNRTIVWLNDLPQRGLQDKLSKKPASASPDLTVTLPSGKKIMLKAGQHYDLNSGRVKDIDEE